MARLIIVNPSPQRKHLILGILVALIIIALSQVKTQPPMPIHLRVIMFLAGIVAIFLCFWRLTCDPKLHQNVLRLYREIKVENDRIIFPKELKLKPGILECWYEVTPGDTDMPYRYTFIETGDTVKVRELSIKDFKGHINVFAGFDSRRVIPSMKVASVWLEWIKLPAYEVIDDDYRVFGHSIYLAALPSAKQHINVGKATLFVTNGKDMGLVEIKSGESLEGVLSFRKEDKARGIRLEFVFETSNVSCKSVIASLNNSGSTHFRFRTTPDETIFMLASGLFLSTKKIIKEIGTKPIVIGDVLKEGKAKIKLILDLPKATDVVDETDVFVSYPP